MIFYDKFCKNDSRQFNPSAILDFVHFVITNMLQTFFSLRGVSTYQLLYPQTILTHSIHFQYIADEYWSRKLAADLVSRNGL